MSSPEPKARIIAPHTFVSDGWRWHVRAFDFLTETFRDFLLARILRAQECEPLKSQMADACKKERDVQWSTLVTLKITPHPGLSPQQQAVVATDFEMVNGEVLFPVRQACLFYVLRQLRFLQESEHPAEQQIFLANREEVLLMLDRPKGQGGGLE
jgi:predicted DNA-binding transcriptional regulator YafY